MSPSIEFTIDPDTGEMTMDIAGEQGRACDDIAKLVNALAGTPESTTLKPEYYQQPAQIRRKVQP